MLVGMFDSWNIPEVHDFGVLCFCGLQVECIYHIYTLPREERMLYYQNVLDFPKYDIFMLYSMYYMSVESDL
jgi:hypothetical protein